MYFEIYYFGWLDLVNTIFYGNEITGIPIDSVWVTITNSDVEGSSSGFDPMFVSPSADFGPGYDGMMADWSLQLTSPCINAGTPDTTGLAIPHTDLAGNLRISGDTIDIGAYEYPLGTKISSLHERIYVSVYPNPSNRDFTICAPEIILIRIYSLVTGIVYDRECSNTSVEHIDTGHLSEGVYVLEVETGNGVFTEKLVIRK